MRCFRRSMAAVLLLTLGLPSCGAPTVSLPNQPPSRELAETHAINPTPFLYAVAFSGNVVSYRLPMHSGEAPAASTAVKAQGVAAQGAYLFAATDDGGSIAEFKLPLLNGAKPYISLAIANAGAIATSKNFVYVSRQGSPGAVSAYVVPLTHGESPTATISEGVDMPAALAADSTHLYVANQGGTLSAYVLPLHKGETPEATMSSLHEESGIAVHGAHLYVSRFDTAQVFVYALPLVTGEKPSVTLTTPYSWTGALAATSTDLFVSDVASYAWDYARPIRAGETASKYVSVYNQKGNMLAVPP